MFATSGCVSQSDFDAKVERVEDPDRQVGGGRQDPEEAVAKIKELEDKVVAAQGEADKAEKDQKPPLIKSKAWGREYFAAAKEATATAVKEVTEKADKDLAAAKEAAQKEAMEQDQIARRRSCCRQGRCGQGRAGPKGCGSQAQGKKT